MGLLLQALPGILVPAVIAGVLALVGDLLARRGAAGWRPFSAALGAAVGYAAAHRVISGSWPPLPFGERTLTSQHWRFWLAPVAAALAALLVFVARWGALAWIARTALVVASLRAVLDARFRHGDPTEAWTWLAAGSAALLFGFFAVERAARVRGGLALGVQLVLIGSATALAFQWSRNSSNAQLVGAITSTMGGVSALAVLGRRPELAVGPATFWVPALGMAWLEGVLYGKLPLLAAGLALAALIALGIASWGGGERPASRARVALGTLTVGALAIAAAWVAYAAAPASTGPYPY